jgi:hypothetical protein
MTVSICAGIANLSGNNSAFGIYPNPVNDEFHVISPVSNHAMKIRIYDVNGKMVVEKEMDSSLESVDTGKLSCGAYFVEILEEGVRVYNTKIIKQ